MKINLRFHVSLLTITASMSSLAMQMAPWSRADDINPLYALVDAAAQRLQTAGPVAATKYVTGGAVDDPQREQQVIDTVVSAAAAAHIDTGYVKDVFRNQIDATDAIEHALFADWKLGGSAVPTAAPDLTESRNTIDKLNHVMVDEIAANWDLLHSPTCAVNLEQAKNTIIAARQLDGLYQRALTYATRSYCR